MNLAQYFAETDDKPEKLAERARCDLSTIYRIMQGTRNAGPKLRKRIIAATGGLVDANGLYQEH